MKYRPEVDGLRAIAVLSVILFHAGFEWVRGGYVGVDIFFVISGYLITTLILSEHAAGRFSLATFYERRARRILPALFFVMAVCIPFAWFWMLPYQLKDFAKSVLSVLVFSSNVLFWRESGYFEAATELKPLLHTWSLAIEEQFYVVFPLVVMVTWRLGRRALPVLVVLALITSLGLAEWASRKGIIVANFYLLPTRAWELLIGSAVAMYLLRHPQRPSPLAGAGALLGLVMVLFSILRFDRTTPFPSLLALVPTVGAALMIVFAQAGGLVYRLLASPPAVGIGVISYSAYLWHQPLFAFARLMLPDPSRPGWLYAALIAATLALGWISWKHVEQPFRGRGWLSRRQVFLGALVGSLALAAVAVPMVMANGVISRFPAKDHYLLSISPTELGRYTERRFRQAERQAFDAAGASPRVLLVGDSYAQDFLNMVGENGFMASAQIVSHPIAARCPKYIGPDDVAPLYAAAGEHLDAAYCAAEGNLRDVLPLVRTADVVILAGQWRTWEAQRITQTVQSLGLRPQQRLIIIGRKDFGTIAPLSYLANTEAQRLALTNQVPAMNAEVNSLLRASLPAEQFVDVQQTLCGASGRCRIFTADGALISFDGEHFTPDGARHAGRLVFDHPALAPLR
ncbi:acyltransferase family protein [Pseudaquabacterium pictum]|uniref:Acyltransferase n=1 Tax=Pseudaquabacterium pictum TaxID=2315236 RepID=A0A480APB6_9BURK|nr:acyltransferase family protein [Rubrivivax pictus]GCL63479.1 hypothetical protein AQPW35_25600 [Rubrivivax pictus]